MMFSTFLNRKRRYQGYLQTRQALNQLSEADLADMGIKRYQLDHVARVKALA